MYVRALNRARNPPDVDGDPVDVSVAMSTGKCAEKNFCFARAREFLRSQIKSSGLFSVRLGCAIVFFLVFFFSVRLAMFL